MAMTLMGYPDRPIKSYVDSIGWGIEQKNGSCGEPLLLKISDTYE